MVFVIVYVVAALVFYLMYMRYIEGGLRGLRFALVFPMLLLSYFFYIFFLALGVSLEEAVEADLRCEKIFWG